MHFLTIRWLNYLEKGIRMQMIIKILGVMIAVMISIMAFKNNQVPTGLGVNEGILSPVPDSPNGVSTQTEVEEKKVEPLPFIGDLEASKERILEAVKAYGKHHVKVKRGQYLHIVFKTGTMQYKDDAEFYFDVEEGLIHFRSASRIGHSDMGLNRERYEAIRNLYLGN